MPSVLFLTAADPVEVPYWNSELPAALSSAGIDTTVAAWTSPETELIELAAQHTHICLITAAHYNFHMPVFTYLLTEIIPAIQKRVPDIRIMNSVDLTLWNASKTYLVDLQSAGFLLPQSAACDVASFEQNTMELLSAFTNGAGGSVIVKPATGADGLNVCRIKNSSAPTAEDVAAIKPLLQGETIILQEFLPDVQTSGELSLIYVGGQFLGAALKKVNRVRIDEFRVNGDHGGSVEITNDVPQAAIATGERITSWLADRYGPAACTYMRLDGVVRQSDGAFFIMGAYSEYAV